MKKLYLPFALVALFATLLTACAKQPYFDLRVVNKTGAVITHARVYYEKFDFTFGNLGPGPGGAEYGFAGTCRGIPTYASIEWVGADGVMQHKSVEVKSRVPSKFKEMTIIFTIEKDGSVAVSWKEM